MEILADRRRHGKSQIAVDVDLADRKTRRVAEHFFGDADRVRHVAAVFVDHLHELGDNAGCAVQNDRESGQPLFNLFEDVKSELRLGRRA